MSNARDDAVRQASAEADLQDALQELIASGEQPEASALEAIVAHYPQHAAELTDFAVEWALQELLPEGTPSDLPKSAVPAAMQRFQARLEVLKDPTSTLQGNEAASQPVSEDPFADRTPAELKQVAVTLGIDKTMLAKLRDRKIVADTIPNEFREGLAEALEVPAGVISAHLARPAVVYAGASFKATEKPEAGPKETFAEAVQRSFLETSEKDRWLASSRASDPEPADG